LLVSELVTNVIQHAGTFIEVCVAINGEEVRIAVRDGSTQAPHLRDPRAEAEVNAA